MKLFKQSKETTETLLEKQLADAKVRAEQGDANKFKTSFDALRNAAPVMKTGFGA